MLNRFLVIIPLAIPLCGYSQGYADSPFYKIVSAVPSTARAVGGENIRTSANGIVIDVSMLEPAPFTPRLTNAGQIGARRNIYFTISASTTN